MVGSGSSVGSAVGDDAAVGVGATAVALEAGPVAEGIGDGVACGPGAHAPTLEVNVAIMSATAPRDQIRLGIARIKLHSE